MNERKILAAFMQSREAWSQAASYVDPDKDMSPEASIILKHINEFYEADENAKLCDSEILIARIERSIPSNKVSKVVTGLVAGLSQAETSGTNVAKEIIALRANSIGLEIASRLASGKSGPDVLRLMSEYSDVLSRTSLDAADEDEVQGLPVKDLIGVHFNREGLIRLSPPSLNELCDGGARPGHHIVVFAPTEMGKTLFTINLVSGFLEQGLRVLYVGNEDPAADILMRVITRLTERNKYDVQKYPDKAQAVLDKRNYDKLVVASLAPGTFPRIHRLIEKYDPQVLVLDQLRNLDVAVDSRTQALERAATEARNTAKRFNLLVVSVTQAADSASGRAVLSRGDVDSSNVGIPGQADLMIGIGATEEMEAKGFRAITPVKNKLSGRHETLTVTFDPTISKVLDT